MGKGAAARVSRGLIDAGLRPDTPALVVENASLPDERIFATPLNLLAISAAAVESGGPMILLIGEAVRLPMAERQQWTGSQAVAVEAPQRA